MLNLVTNVYYIQRRSLNSTSGYWFVKKCQNADFYVLTRSMELATVLPRGTVLHDK